MLGKMKQNREEAKLFTDLAELLDVVYLGQHSAEDSDHPLMGVTFAPNAEDRHFLHGNYQEHELSILRRKVELHAPNMKSDTFDWTVIRIEMQRAGLPHLFIDSRHVDELFHSHVFAKFGHLNDITNSLPHRGVFAKHFTVYGSARLNGVIDEIITQDIANLLVSECSDVDIELDGSLLYLQRPAKQVTPQQMKQLVDTGIKVADLFETMN